MWFYCGVLLREMVGDELPSSSGLPGGSQSPCTCRLVVSWNLGLQLGKYSHIPSRKKLGDGHGLFCLLPPLSLRACLFVCSLSNVAVVVVV